MAINHDAYLELEAMAKEPMVDMTIDLAELRCPLPVLRTKKALAEMRRGQILEVITADPSSVQDIPKFADLAKHRLIANESTKDGYRFLIQCDH